MQITDQMKSELINAGWISPDTVREKTLKWFITSADVPASFDKQELRSAGSSVTIYITDDDGKTTEHTYTADEYNAALRKIKGGA